MKVINIVLTILFAVFAVVQFNDPDPWFWVLLYGFIAVISGFAIVGKYYKRAIYIGMAICFLGVVIFYPDFRDWMNMGSPNIAESMKAEKPHIEFVREFFGLVICFLALLFHFFQKRKIDNA